MSNWKKSTKKISKRLERKDEMTDLSNEQMIQTQKEGIRFLQFRKLKEYEPKLLHGYTTKDLNFRKGECSMQSAEKMKNALGVDALWIKTAQTHSDHIRIIRKGEKTEKILEDTDGIITNQKNLLVFTIYADCTPILIYDIQKEVIANVHSGWRGTIQKIGIKALQKMKDEFGCEPKDCIVTIGPNIQKCCFEVGEEVEELFRKSFGRLLEDEESMVKLGMVNGEEKFKIDTSRLNRLIFEEAGISSKQIIESKICSKCNGEILHSYRADGKNSGRSAMFTLLQG